MTDTGPAGLRHLMGRVAVIESRVRRAVAQRLEVDPHPDDPFRGLYLTDEAVAALLGAGREPLAADALDEEQLGRTEAEADEAERSGADLRLRRLARTFALTPLDVEVLLVALAPDVDARFEQLYGYLNDDVTRRRASIGLALTLCGVPEAAAGGRSRFEADAPLVAGGLLVVEDRDRPMLSRAVRVPDRVAGHLLGVDNPDPLLGEVLLPDPPAMPAGADPVRVALDHRIGLTYLRERLGAGGTAVACTAVRTTGRRPVALDLRRLAGCADAAAIATVAVREARLRDAVLVGGPVEALAERPEVIRALTAPSIRVVLAGSVNWDPAWSRATPLLLEIFPPGLAERSALWRDCLDGTLPEDLDPGGATVQFVLTPEQVARAAQSATLHAAVRGEPLTAEDVRRGARSQNAVGLGRLARRIEPAVGWADLVLPEVTLAELREIAIRARHRGRVLDDWRMRPGGGRGRGVTALFAGDSGTGKTMSAEVIAADLGLDLYAVDLSSVIDKYVGETEKNLERIFSEAAGVNAVLLFDEADAIFGKRSEVRDAHDRYANVESAFLLQRMESFDGLALLATNLRANLDEALTRRLDLVVDFPMPEAALRTALWDRCLGGLIPRSPDLDLEFCAASFELSGGNIRSAVVAAAYLAAKEDRPVSTADLVRGVYREYRKLGRLTLQTEFGRYFAQVL